MASPIVLSVTLATASALALLYVVLLLRIVRVRLKDRVSLGDGGNAELLKRIRAHGNFAEYVPLLLILMGLIELAGTSTQLLAIAGVGAVIFRICHAIGMHRQAPNPFRFIGTVGTFTTIIVFAISGLWLALG
jgi:uncharacterized protein